MKKICFVSSSRADYGLLKNLMSEISTSKKLSMQLIVSGTHLSEAHGLTIKQILADGFLIDAQIPILGEIRDTPIGISEHIASAIKGFARAYSDLKPDFILLLGDRYEIFAAAISATISKIPIIHLHGGEVTIGAYDESFRHAITKMSHIHFAAAAQYRDRIIQLGEHPKNVFFVGGLGVDSINRTPLYERDELCEILDIELKHHSLLITYHPETLGTNSADYEISELLNALDSLDETTICFTMPNADNDSSEIIKKIRKYVSKHENAYFFTSLGQKKYFSCLKTFGAVVGNSSSGLLEAPTFKIPTINIGKRQSGRLKANSVIDCKPKAEEIKQAIGLAFSEKFRSKLENTINPYGEGGASKKIKEIIETYDFKNILYKEFYDL
jgi:GDP/UDP-N,N'-diacetylbacillosamine 2-epimerase (hydrolysing)